MIKESKAIIVEGNIGAGKSTFLRLINDLLDVQVVYEPHEQWQNVDQRVSMKEFNQSSHDVEREVELCVSNGLKLFAKEHPDRAYVLEMVVEVVDSEQIAERLGRTYDALRQYLMQCRKYLKPYIENCYLMLKAE